MSPDQRSDRAATENPACARCGGPLDGNVIACPPCQEAAEVAVRERKPNQSILPADIAAIRERMG